MNKNKVNKWKSIAVIVIMALSILTASFIFIGEQNSVKAVPGTPGSFSITAPTNRSKYIAGRTINVTWGAASDAGGYNLDVIGGGTTDTNVTSADNTKTYYSWTPTRPGWYTLNVYAFNGSNNTYATLNNVTVKIITPGYNGWQGANTTVDTETPLKAGTTDTSDLYYGNTLDIYLNTSATWSGAYNLYYPVYKGQKGGTAYSLNWKKYQKTGQDPYFQSGTQDYFDGVELNITGMWLIDNQASTTDATFTSYANFNNTVAAWFWVNTTTDYEISDIDDFYYNDTGTFTLEGTDDEGAVACIVDIRRDSNFSSIFGENKWEGDGSRTVYKNRTYFWSAGNYSAYVYADLDVGDPDDEDDQCYYLEGNMDQSTGFFYYNKTYGANSGLTDASNNFAAATNYDWSLCGPWDPPEYNATPHTIRVMTGEPYTDVENNTQYWGFDGEVNVTFMEDDDYIGTFTENQVTVKIYDDDDVDVTSHFGYQPGGSGQIDRTNIAKGWIHINMTAWGKNKSSGGFADNGTWTAVIYVDINSDRNNYNKEFTEEWNATVEWDVKRSPKSQFKWIDDDGNVGGVEKWGHAKNTNSDGVIPYVPDKDEVPLMIQFQVFSQGGYYFGDTAGNGYAGHSGKCKTNTECQENITISGNALFTGTLDKIPGAGYYGHANGTWYVPIIPTMDVGGGEITIMVDAYNSSSTETIQIGGTNYGNNGTYVTVTPNEFEINQDNQTLTVTAKDTGSNAANPYCDVYLYYINDNGGIDGAYDGDGIVSHVGPNDYSNGYSVPFNKSEQFTNQTLVDFNGDGTADGTPKAPRNLTIYVSGSGNRKGYALINMQTINDLEVELSHDTLMAGYAYDNFYINCTFAGNSTDTPSEDDADSFFINIYDRNDNEVTGTLLNGISANDLTNDDDYIFGDFDNAYALNWWDSPYTVYAYNNTHTSKGYNATLYVNPVNVVCDKAPLIWSADNNITATCTITYDGKYNESVEGDFRLQNVTEMNPSTGDYNKTWTNTSDAGNSTLDIDDSKITDGVVVINDLTANYLDAEETNQTITFYFRPSQSSSTWAKAGKMLVRVPTVTPDPIYIPIAQKTRVTCTVTGRGETLSDVYVRVHGVGGIDINGTSDAIGEVDFSLSPSAAGNISIDVGEEDRTLANSEAVIIATNWVLNVVVSPDTVDEGDSFTVTVTDESSGEAVEDATVTINGIGSADTDADGEVSFTAPSVTSDRTYTIKASKEGYAPETDTITIFVTNIPELVISADAKVQAGATFDIAVAKDTGDPVVGATVTLDGEEYKTKAGGVATLTAPNKAKDYTIKATFKDFVAAETTITVEAGGVPGFELLTLIAAIGVAFILLRKRRNK